MLICQKYIRWTSPSPPNTTHKNLKGVQGSVPTDQAQTLNQILINKYGFGLDGACFEYYIDKIQKIIKQ